MVSGTSFDELETPRKTGKALKRTSSLPFGPVTEVTPKRARTCLVASPSPSIKMWLKRSASEPTALESANTDSLNNMNQEQTDLQELSATVGKGSPTENSASTQSKNRDDLKETKDRLNESISRDLPKRRKLECQSSSSNDKMARKSCKRKLTDIDPEGSPKKHKKQKPVHDNDENSNSNSSVQNSLDIGENTYTVKAKSPSPRKSEVLRSMDSELNKSPVKEDISNPCISPLRLQVKDWNSEVYASPTANLPNLVVDGPVITNTLSAECKKTKTVDWLTQMRIQKMNKDCSSKVKTAGVLNQSLTMAEELPISSSGSTAPSKPGKHKVWVLWQQ